MRPPPQITCELNSDLNRDKVPTTGRASPSATIANALSQLTVTCAENYGVDDGSGAGIPGQQSYTLNCGEDRRLTGPSGSHCVRMDRVLNTEHIIISNHM